MWNQNENNWKEKEDECWSRNETKDPLPSRCDWERGPTCLSKTGRSRSAPLSLSLFSGSGAASPRFPREREREAGGRGDGRLRAGDDGAQDARHPHPREEGRPRQDQGTNPPSPIPLLLFSCSPFCGSDSLLADLNLRPAGIASLHCLLLPLTFDFHAPHLLCTCWRNFLVLTKSTALFRFQFVKQKGISRLPYFCLHCQLECKMLIYTHAIPRVPRF